LNLSGAFKKSKTGDVLFYPWGIMGKGYKLTSQSQENRVRSFFQTYYIVTLSTFALVQATIGWKGSVIVVVAGMIWYGVGMTRLLKDTPTTDERLSIADSLANTANSQSLVNLVLLEIVSVLFVAAAILILRGGGPPLVPLAAIAFFGLGSVMFGFMILKKLKG